MRRRCICPLESVRNTSTLGLPDQEMIWPLLYRTTKSMMQRTICCKHQTVYGLQRAKPQSTDTKSKIFVSSKVRLPAHRLTSSVTWCTSHSGASSSTLLRLQTSVHICQYSIRTVQLQSWIIKTCTRESAEIGVGKDVQRTQCQFRLPSNISRFTPG